ncbi:hypothetical protein MMC14_008701 [Varicellaria rhodocarpa]|nr:hypothetical protein [Varicellaria rhodocarpa]
MSFLGAVYVKVTYENLHLRHVLVQIPVELTERVPKMTEACLTYRAMKRREDEWCDAVLIDYEMDDDLEDPWDYEEVENEETESEELKDKRMRFAELAFRIIDCKRRWVAQLDAEDDDIIFCGNH